MDIIASIVIPTHDAAAYLGQALRSASRQSLRATEILVVDDGSRDGTWDLLLHASARDPRIRPFRRDAAGGPGAARNAGMRMARGRWVALLDADDLFLPRRLERLVALAEREQADLVADDQLVCRFASGERLGRLFGRAALLAAPRPLGLGDLIRRDMPAAGAGDAAAIGPAAPAALGYAKPVFRRAFLARHALAFDERLRAGEDLLFHAACVAHGGRYLLTPEVGYLYRRREGSASRRPGLARMQALANRELAALAAKAGDAEALALLARRQDWYDRAALADAAGEGAWLDAVALARWRRPGLLAGDLRLLAGAARRRVRAGQGGPTA